MSGKLDQSLDDILKTRRKTTSRGGPRSRGKTTRTTRVSTRAPSGGVTKTTTKVTTTTAKTAQPVVPITGSGESKILVSGLPPDVSEQQIKDYFAKTIGPVKKVFLTYGPTGQSRGISTIVFNKPGSAHEAATQLNGVKVDNRAMKIEVIVGANQAPIPVPPKALGERIASNKAAAKNQPKSAAATTTASKKTTATAARGSTKARRGRGSGRGKPKTAAELDAEMTDYFDPSGANGSAGVNGTAQPAATGAAAAGGDTGMEDEIM